MKIRKGDTVLVISGKDRSKRGKVERVYPETERIIVEGVNVVTRHVKPVPPVRQGGRIQQPSPLSISNVLLICTSCSNPVRVGFKKLEDGSKVRICRKCKETIT
jgi:large subunit ribosomal protein L24